MEKNIRLCLSLMLLALAMPLFSQKITTPQYEVEMKDWNLIKGGDSLYISFSLSSDKMDIPSNKSVRLVPMLVKEDSVYPMTPVIIAGRRQFISSQRRNDKGILVRNSHAKTRADYRSAIAYREWMNTANVVLSLDQCGCGGDPYDSDNRLLRTLDLNVPIYQPQPVMAFAVPEVEAVKHRQESGSAFLDFPVNKTVIYPEYRRNSVELGKIRATIDVVKNDTNTHITGILIHGYASPEGSFANNRRLAQGRAEALKQYVKQQYGFVDTIFQVRSTPEDWDGLKKYVQHSSLEQRDKVLAIIDNKLNEDEKNSRIEKIDGRKTYLFLLNNIYPALRHSDYTVNYTVRPFNVEEAKRVLKTRPQLLSLNEMFMVANTCEPGSQDFKEVFEIAVNMFPENTTANLNAANIALSEGNWQRAERYLLKAGNSAKATHARGVCALLKGDYPEAEKLLKQASKEGVAEAEKNLEQLKLKLENIERIKENNL